MEKEALAMVISNGIFSGPHGKPLPTRDQAEQFGVSMVKVYSEWGNEVVLKNNLTASQMRQAILDFRNDPKHQMGDSTVVIIASHGHSRSIYGSDGELVDLAEVIDPFNDQNCPSLAGKHKSFIIHACEVEPVGPGEGRVVHLSDLSGPDMSLVFFSDKADPAHPITFSTGQKGLPE